MKKNIAYAKLRFSVIARVLKGGHLKGALLGSPQVHYSVLYSAESLNVCSASLYSKSQELLLRKFQKFTNNDTDCMIVYIPMKKIQSRKSYFTYQLTVTNPWIILTKWSWEEKENSHSHLYIIRPLETSADVNLEAK